MAGTLDTSNNPEAVNAAPVEISTSPIDPSTSAGTSALVQPGGQAPTVGQPGYQPPAPQAPPPTPTLADKHPVLFNMLKNLTVGVDSFAKAVATHGREGGVQEVQQYQAEQQRQQVQKQQAQREEQEGNMRMEGLRANMAINSFKLEQDRLNAPLERQQLMNNVEEQKANFIEHLSKIYGISPIVVKYMEGDSTASTLGAVSSTAAQNNTDPHNLMYAHTQTDGKPGKGGDVVALDLKALGSKSIPAELSDTAMAGARQTVSIGEGILPANSPNMVQAKATLGQMEAGLKSGSLSVDQFALLQNKVEMLVHAPLAKQQAIDDFNKQQADSTKAQQEADPVHKLSQPEELAKPGIQSSIQALIKDPKTKPTDIPRLNALMGLADQAQKRALEMKAREKQNEQAVTQGDAPTAGKLLANRTLTLPEMKARGVTPAFIQQAVTEAQKVDPNFKAPEAEAQARIAAAPVNQQFFGNTDSLLVKGGTLDQLAGSEANLPSGRFPVFNKYSEAVSASTGFGSTSRYAASVVGVADDYAKVMGGSIGTDTARQTVMDMLKAAKSKTQLDAAIAQVRQQVLSQRDGRIGSNPYLRDMYPTPQGTDMPGAGGKSSDPAAAFGGVTR